MQRSSDVGVIEVEIDSSYDGVPHYPEAPAYHAAPATAYKAAPVVPSIMPPLPQSTTPPLPQYTTLHRSTMVNMALVL